MDILFILKMDILFRINDSTPPPPQLCQLLNLEWSTHCEHVVQSLSSTHIRT